MKKVLLIHLVFFINISALAQNYTIPLWEKTPPNFKASDEKEIVKHEDGITTISDVQIPDIAVFLPSQKIATGEAVVICPGGGYWVLAYDLEGTDIAKYFNSKGIAAIVLKYRLPVSKSNIEAYKSPLLDAQRAMRMVRYNAEKWNIEPDKIGIMGFSAGGHLASTLSTHFDRGNSISNDSIEQQSCRPDFSLLIYPVISTSKEIVNQGSFNALFGNKKTNKKLIENFSNELMVTENTPPAILIHANDDPAVSPMNSIVYYKALLKYGINSELHIYPHGGHGFGLAAKQDYLSEWPDKCVDFIHYLFDSKTEIKTF